MKYKSLLSLLLVVLFLNACTPSVVSTEDIPTPIQTEEPQPIPTQTEPAPQPEQPVVTSWRAVRDPRYGFGFAIPCWWLTNPNFTNDGLQTIKNYDEAYFNAHSQKGFWDWPNGTLKLDIVTMEGNDPSKTDAEAYMENVDPTMTGLVSAEAQQFGSHTATVLTLSNLINTNDPDTMVFIFRLAPDKLLMIVPIPQTVIDTPDFQALLTSVVLTADEQVALPLIPPASALIDASCAG